MKKNSLLLLIAVSLTVFVYFFQEKGDEKIRAQRLSDNLLFNKDKLGSLLSFSTNEIELVRGQGDRFYITRENDVKKKADPRKVQSFFDALASIHIKEIIDEQVVKEQGIETFFTTSGSRLEKLTFKFHRDEIEFFLGRKLEFDQAFYLKVNHNGKSKYVIAFDTAALNQAVRKENYHRNDIKYRRFQSLFYLGESYFYDYRIFSEWMDQKWSLNKVDFKSKRERGFTFDFSSLTLNPKKPTFLSLNLKSLKKFEKDLVSLEAKGFVTKGGYKLDQNLGQLRIVNSREQKSEIDFYAIDSGVVAKTSFDDHWFLFSFEQVRDVLKSYHHFLDLSPIKKEVSVVKLQFKNSNKSIKTDNSKLISFLKRGATYMATSTDLEGRYRELFQLDWGQGPFSVKINEKNLLLISKSSYTALVYPLEGELPFPVKEESYL